MSPEPLPIDQAEEIPTANESPKWRRRLVVVAVLITYAALGVAANWPSWAGGVTHTMQCGGCGDSGQEVWFLAWAGHALIHLQNPLRTTAINFPWGVDLADNTSMPLAGVLATPITVLFGPVASFNVMFSFAFASSAAAMFFLLRRFVRWTLAAFVGGLLYGFSPYMVGQGEGHVFLLLAPIPPLLVLLLHEILVRQSARWWLMGLALGCVMLIQLGWSAELLVCALTVAAIGVIVVCVARASLIRSHLAYATKALALGAVITAPAALWFAHVSRSGPEHLPDAVHSPTMLAGLSTDVASLVVPTLNQHFSFGWAATGTSFVSILTANGTRAADVAENGCYIGIPILLLLLIGVIRYWRNGLVRFSIVMAFISLVLSMGSRLHVWGHYTSIRLPFDLFVHLPYLKNEVASRYCLFMWLFIALVVAVVLDQARWATPVRKRLHGQSPSSRVLARWPLGLMTALAVGGLVSLVPGWPYNIGQVVTPNALVRPTVVSSLDGGTLLTYPLARSTHNMPMTWQAIDDFEYRIPAGEASVANPHSSYTEAAFAACWQAGEVVTAPPSSLVAGARQEFVTWEIRAVVIPMEPSINPMCAVRFVQEVLGRAPVYERGAAVWTNVSMTGG